MTDNFKKYSQFYKPQNTEQTPEQIIDITNWTMGGDFDPYGEGTRSKYVVYCPNNTNHNFLIPKHRYLYKKTFERNSGFIAYEQFWIEIISYKIGRYLGVEVPPAFIACRTPQGSNKVEYASLIEWFHSYPSAPQEHIDRGGDFMSDLIQNYDRDKGKQHNLKSIIELFQNLDITDWQEKWARMLLFDALIGNTDRHQENWEVVSYFDKSNIHIDLSPAFDNGTAMGYEVLQRKIPAKTQNIQAYIDKGRHHMRWDIDDAKEIKHFDLLQKLIATYPQTQAPMAKILSHDISKLCEDIISLTKYDLQNDDYRLTPERADFIINLLIARYKKAKEVVGL